MTRRANARRVSNPKTTVCANLPAGIVGQSRNCHAMNGATGASIAAVLCATCKRLLVTRSTSELDSQTFAFEVASICGSISESDCNGRDAIARQGDETYGKLECQTQISQTRFIERRESHQMWRNAKTGLRYCNHTWNDVARIICIFILDEAKATHELDLGDLPRAMVIEMVFDLLLGG